MGKRFVTVLLLLIVVSAAYASLLRAPANSGGVASQGTIPLATLATPTGQYFDYVVIIEMENKALTSIYGSASAPFETGLANTYALAKKMTAVDHPSEPNYLSLLSGLAGDCANGGNTTGGCMYGSGSSTTDNAPSSTYTMGPTPNIVDRFEAAGVSWKAFAEDLTTPCTGSNLYPSFSTVRHFPFYYFTDITGNASRCAKTFHVTASSDSELLSSLNSTSTAANFNYFSPNDCNNMHDCSVSVGDTYLKGTVSNILNTTIFKTKRAVVIVTFDEGTTSYPNDFIYTAFAGPSAKRGYSSTTTYRSSYALLRTFEDNWGLAPLNGMDGGSSDLSEFFTSAPVSSPVARFTSSPTWPKVNAAVAFDASSSSDPNPNATLQYRWDWTNDGTWDTTWSTNSGASHAYPAAGSYTARLEVQDNLGQTGNATHVVVADSEVPTTANALTGTLGSNGWYRSSVSVTLTATDDLSGVASTKYRKDNGSWSTYSSAFTVSGDGSHSVDYYSVDNAGNTESTHTVYLKIDTVAPTTTAALQGSLNGSLYLGPVTVTLSASDAASGVASTKVRVDGGSWATYASPVTVSANGTHTVAYYSTDQAGNTEATKNVSFSIGSPPAQGSPVTTMSLSGTAGNASWYISNVSVTLSATDPAGLPVTIHYRLDAGPWLRYTSAFAVGDGLHELDYNATDSASNQESTRVATIRVDTDPPQTNATLSGTHGRDHWYVSAVTVTLAATDLTSGVASTVYNIDGAAWQTYTGPFSVGKGRHTVGYFSTDGAGMAEPLNSVPIKVASSAPTLAVSPVSAVQTASSVTISWSETADVASITETDVGVDGGPLSSVGLNTTDRLSLPDGEHVIEIRAVDEAGNQAWANLTVRVDTNIFSPTGPLQGMPSYVLLTILAGAGVFAVIHHRSRVKRERRLAALRRLRNAKY